MASKTIDQFESSEEMSDEELVQSFTNWVDRDKLHTEEICVVEDQLVVAYQDEALYVFGRVGEDEWEYVYTLETEEGSDMRSTFDDFVQGSIDPVDFLNLSSS